MARAGKYIAALGLFLAAFAVAAGAVGAWKFGNAAYASSAIAAAMIWLVGSVGLVLIALSRSGPARLNAILLSMLIRMALPLAAIVIIPRIDPPLPFPGLVGMILVHYLAGLAMESYLATRLVASKPTNESVVPRSHILPSI